MTRKTNIPVSDRGFIWSIGGGDDSNDGRSAEVPKQTLQGCITAVNALIPLPPAGGLASISNLEDDFITAPITLPAATTVLATGVAISGTEAGAMLTLGGDRQTVEISTVANSGTGDSVDLTGLTNVDFRSQITSALGGGSAFNIAGTSENLFIKTSQMRVSGGSTGFKIRGTATSPYDINVDSASLETSGDTLIDYNPSAVTDIGTLNITSVVDGVSGTCVFTVDGGSLDTAAQALAADKLAIVQNDARFGLDVNETIGDLETHNTSTSIIKSSGLFIGDVTTADTSTVYLTSNAFTGNITLEDTSGVYLTLDKFTGDLDVPTGTTAYVDIKHHVGSITDQSGTINGWINGVPYGNAIQSGYILATWGANLQTTGRHPEINGVYDTTEIPSLGIQASAQVSAAGTIDTVTYYNTTGDTTTEFQIIVNGVVEYTFTTNTSPFFYGQEMGIGVPVVMNDNVAIRYSAGTAPGNGIYTMYVK